MKLFEVPEDVVVAGVGCTWCCVGIGERCRGNKGYTHAQRWREYHNATHDRFDQYPIYTSYKKQANRIAQGGRVDE